MTTNLTWYKTIHPVYEVYDLHFSHCYMHTLDFG